MNALFTDGKPWEPLVQEDYYWSRKEQTNKVRLFINASSADVTGLLGFISLGMKKELGIEKAQEGARKIEDLVREIDIDYSESPSPALRVRIRGLIYTYAETSDYDASEDWLHLCDLFVRENLDFALDTLLPDDAGKDVDIDDDEEYEYDRNERY